MKKKSTILLALLLIAAWAGIANAIPFSTTHDYAGNGTYLGESYQAIFDVGNMIDWIDTFTFPNVDPEADAITAATFSITHVGNISTFINAELWLLTDQTGQSIGSLSESAWESWTTDTFVLSDAVIDTIMSTNPWSLGIKISEETWCIDWMYVDKATFAGQYDPISGNGDPDPAAPVPEPTTLLLLGSGLIGVMGIRRKIK